MHSNKLAVLPCLVLSLAILIPVINGQIINPASLSADSDIRAEADEIKGDIKPCCIPSGNSCVESTCNSCCSQKIQKNTCYQCGKDPKTPGTTECAAPSLVVKTKPACCIPDGFSCDEKSCKNCCTRTKSSYTCLQCA